MLGINCKFIKTTHCKLSSYSKEEETEFEQTKLIITKEKVQTALERMKNGKATRPEGMVRDLLNNEEYTLERKISSSLIYVQRTREHSELLVDSK